MQLHFTIPDNITPLTVKKFLHKQGVSRHLWRQLKQHNRICLNGIPINATLTYASPGDKLTCELPENSSIIPKEIPLTIIFEDEHLLVINKQAGLLVHPILQEQTDTIANAVQFYYKKTNQSCVFHPMHRLDRNTTGLLLIAKTPYIQHLMTGKTLFHRTYLAITDNPFSNTYGEISTSIARKPGSNILREINSLGQAACTHYKVLANTPDLSLVHLTPLTGRTHQLRVHLSSIGHPIMGDDLYGGSTKLMKHQALHSFQCALVHPITQQKLNLTAPLPSDMHNIISKIFPVSSIATLN